MFEITLEDRFGSRLPLTEELGYLVSKIDGLAPVDATINTTNRVRVYGTTYNSSQILGRDIDISVYIDGDPRIARQALYKVAIPGEPITVHLAWFGSEYKAEGYVSSISTEHFTDTQTVSVGIQCQSPYLMSETQKSITGDNIKRIFEFPFSTKDGENFQFGQRLEKTRLITQNSGDVETGAVFSVKLSSAVTGLQIVNENSGEFMSLTGELPSGYLVEISTYSGNRYIKLINRSTGAEQNILARKGENFDWLQIPQGEGVFRIDATEGGAGITATITYTEQFLGV